ncbi:chaperonin 10-like protein [Aspergillus ambiguus]|uniref:2,3-butanediol dehydrogenase n=1 Tax=Aspergillus ambiguus TaxID=176160 RepID=UPI003CCDD161
MRAARFYAGRNMRVETVDPPTPSDQAVLVAVEWCGICGSDLNEYLRGPMAVPNEKTGPHPLTGEVLPVTMGHEFTGRVVHAPASSSLSPGQAVVVDPRYFCSSCIPCSRRSTNCCDVIGFMGISGGGGGLSETVSVPPEKVYPLPNDTDLAAAALIEPLTVAWHGVRLSGIQDFKDTPVLVVGAGPVGVAVVFVLRAHGAKAIFVSEPSAKRRHFLSDIAHAVLDPTKTDVAAKCRELTNGQGVGVVFDCAGSQLGFQAGLDALRFQGQHINLAAPKAPLTLPWYLVMRREAVLKASLAYDETDFKEVVAAYVEGRFQGVERMITRRVSLEEVVEKGFEELSRPNDHIKILATPKVA